MPAEIILQARKENEVVIEGEVHLVINENTPSDIVIEVPNQNGRLLSKEMLSNNTLVSSDTIKRPIILVPENNSIGFTGTFILSPYEPSETYSGVPTGMRIEISTTEDFSMIMKNVVIDELLSEVPVTFEESSEVLYVRVKYVSDSHVSGYSDVVKFTNSDFYVYQPKILTPTLDATGVARTPFIQVSDYQYMGNENYYAGLTYEVATDSNFTNIVETDTVGSPNTGGSGSSNGVYLNNFILNTILDEDTIYYVRVKYLGTLYPSSIWSDVISFRTFNIEEKIKLVKSNGNVNSYFYASIKLGDNIYTVGQLNHSGTMSNCVIYKLDKNLNVVKNVTITLGAGEGGTLTDIKTDGTHIYVCGYIYNTTYRHMPIIVKLDANLELVASKIYNKSNIDADEVFARLLIDNGVIYAVGRIYEATELFTSAIFRFDSSLTLLNHHCYNQSNSGPYESFNDIIIVGTNIFTVGVLHNTTTNRNNGVICKFDSNFNMVGNKVISFGNTIGNFQSITNVIHRDGYLYMAGQVADTINRLAIIKMDLNLNVIKNVVLNISNGGGLNCLTIINNKLYVAGNNWQGSNYYGVVAIFDLNLSYLNHKVLKIKNDTTINGIMAHTNNALLLSCRVYDATNYYATLILLDDKLDISNGTYDDLVVTTPAYTLIETGFVYYSTTYTKYNPTITTVNSIPILTTSNLVTSEIIL